MDIVAIANIKGGVGKSTLAVHLAAKAQHAGRRTRIIDMDEQQSAARWVERRNVTLAGASKLPLIDARDCFAKGIERALQQAEADAIEFVVIDTPPHQSLAPAAAVSAAHVTLVPIRPGVLDMDAIGQTLDMLEETGAFAFGILNMVKAKSVLADEAAELVAKEGLTLAPIRLNDRQDYNTALLNGLTAPEVKPGDKHSEEINGLWKWLQIKLKQGHARPRAEVLRVADAADAPARLSIAELRTTRRKG